MSYSKDDILSRVSDYATKGNFKDFDDFYEDLEQKGFFEEEIIYYYKAIEYLKENDPSLRESLDIAEEYGYNVSSINSELLATLLASTEIRNAFFEYEEDIKNSYDLQGFKKFPELTSKIKSKVKRAFNKSKLKNTNMNGFSRAVVSPTEEMNGFSRMDYIIDGYTLNDYDMDEDELDGYTLSGYELNGRSMRRLRRFYRKNAPWSYIGTVAVGLVVLDVATGGKVRETFGMKKKKK
jgi:hypothetical protein